MIKRAATAIDIIIAIMPAIKVVIKALVLESMFRGSVVGV